MHFVSFSYSTDLNSTQLKAICKSINGETYIDQKSCKENLEVMFTITRYSCLLFLGIRIGFKTLQFIAKLQTSIKKSDLQELWEFFSKQNVNEILLHNLTVAFFIVQYCEKEEKLKSGWQEHLLGWAIFLAWIDLTIILGRFDIFGRHIYRSGF